MELNLKNIIPTYYNSFHIALSKKKKCIGSKIKLEYKMYSGAI